MPDISQKKGQIAPTPFLGGQPPETPILMNNVVKVFINGIPGDSFEQCIGDGEPSPTSTQQLHEALDKFIRQRLAQIAVYEYCIWINGQIPFVTSRELELWRLRQFVEFLWFWNLPDDDDLALIFNYTKRKASNLAADFLARFRKTILFPVAIRRLYQLMNTEPQRKNVDHPRKKWKGCIYRVEFTRYLEHLNTLITEIREQKQVVLLEACYYDREESLIWLPTDLRQIMLNDDKLRDQLFSMYELPGKGRDG